MSYDFDESEDKSSPKVTDFKPDPKDLETIVTMLQLAAIWLTPTVGAIFTLSQLLEQVRQLCGDELIIDEKDIMIVLANSSFLKKEPGKRFSLK
jgi:hypothetical protein